MDVEFFLPLPMPNTLSDPIQFIHEGTNFQAKFQYPSKEWFFHNLDANLYFGSQPDSAGIVSESRAISMLIRLIEGQKEAQEFKKLNQNGRTEEYRRKYLK